MSESQATILAIVEPDNHPHEVVERRHGSPKSPVVSYLYGSVILTSAN